jgi:hypothetical protein
MVADPASGSCGGPTTLSATLRRNLDGAPIVAREISFAFQDDPTNFLCTPNPRTNVNGVATCVFFPSQPYPPPGRSYVATFTGMSVAGSFYRLVDVVLFLAFSFFV